MKEIVVTAMSEDRDYESSGLSIQQAMLDAVRTRQTRSMGPPRIRWGQRTIQTSDCIDVPRSGRFRAEFLSSKYEFAQGFDIKLNGAIRLVDGTEVPVLRTWNDSRYEDSVEYDFTSDDGKLWIWNVYELTHLSGEKETAKWTDNAGLWIEAPQQNQRTYHCSAGPCAPPDFASLVFRLTLLG